MGRWWGALCLRPVLSLRLSRKTKKLCRWHLQGISQVRSTAAFCRFSVRARATCVVGRQSGGLRIEATAYSQPLVAYLSQAGHLSFTCTILVSSSPRSVSRLIPFMGLQQYTASNDGKLGPRRPGARHPTASRRVPRPEPPCAVA